MGNNLCHCERRRAVCGSHIYFHKRALASEVVLHEGWVFGKMVLVRWHTVGREVGGAGISFIPALSQAQVSSSYCVQEPLLAFQ